MQPVKMIKIIQKHTALYPKMQLKDVAKLLYQSEFGGGHMIQNEAACLDFLCREYAATVQTSTPLLEEIGSGMVRVYLAGLDSAGYPIEQLGQDFIRSAAAVRGNMDAFQKSSVSFMNELHL